MVGEQAVLDDTSQKAKRAGGWIIIASVLVVAALALLLALALRPRRPAPPYQVALAPIQAEPPRAWIGDDPVPLPIPVALEVAGRTLPVQPALLISDTWTIPAADAGVAYWAIGTYAPYRLATLDGGIFQVLQPGDIIILRSSGEFRFAIAGEPPYGTCPGLLLSLLGGGSIWADALQAEIPVPPVPTSTPAPTPTPAPWPEVEIISATLEADGAHMWVQVRNIGGGILEVREEDIGPGLLLASPPLPWVVRREMSGELVFEWPCGSINILGWQYEVYAGE